MASILPSRLLGHINGEFFVFDPRSYNVDNFDIVSYTWGAQIAPYNCGIDGVTWDVTIAREKLEDIKRLMVDSGVQYMWVDCVCLNQVDSKEKSEEIAKMFQYYKNARKCHILINMDEVWDPQDIVNNLKFLDHILSHMRGAALASEARLTENLANRLLMWANKEGKEWTFPVDKSMVMSAAVDMGVLNCYSTCIGHVRSLFDNLYFSRVWTFQEMILGKNITLWGINPKSIYCIGELHVWMDLATDSRDKAFKLQAWIENCRVLKTGSVNAILRIIKEDILSLNFLQTQVKGINCARTDIINGGPSWWHENYKGISNIFSAVSLTPRKCGEKADIFRGLLGVFAGLFSPEEIENKMSGDNIEKISFNFFKQLSIKTGFAWTRLAISSRVRGEWDWIPVVENYNGAMATDCFSGVVKLGLLGKQQKGQAKATAITGITGVPWDYMKIRLIPERQGFQFILKGCNCGKKIKSGVFSRKPIPTNDQPQKVVRDETGRILVKCATILGSIIDPGGDIVQYRRRFLSKLRPNWRISDPSAMPAEWIDRCVSGTWWEDPSLAWLRTHNMSMNYNMVDMVSCESRLENESTARISCEVRVNCGCKIIAPFSFIFEAITAVEGSSLGETSVSLDQDNRIILQDGLGLVQAGDVGKTFNLVAFGGEINFYKNYSSQCRSTKANKPVLPQAIPRLFCPRGRALVPEGFKHGLKDMTRDYGYVETGGSGNLLICRNHRLDQYRIIGVCIDEVIENKGDKRQVTIR